MAHIRRGRPSFRASLTLVSAAFAVAAIMLALAAGPLASSASAQTPTPTNTPSANACTGMDITKEADVDEVAEGGQIVYTIEVEFSGDADCLDLLISDIIPDGADCVDTAVSDDTDVPVDDADGCDNSGEVTWAIDDDDAEDADDGDLAIVTMTVELEDDTEEGDEVENLACIFSGDEEEACDDVTVDVGEPAPTATATTQATPTRQATVQPPPAPTLAPPPAPVPTARIVAPVTGSGPDSFDYGPFALALGIAGGLLLTAVGVTRMRRAR